MRKFLLFLVLFVFFVGVAHAETRKFVRSDWPAGPQFNTPGELCASVSAEHVTNGQNGCPYYLGCCYSNGTISGKPYVTAASNAICSDSNGLKVFDGFAGASECVSTSACTAAGGTTRFLANFSLLGAGLNYSQVCTKNGCDTTYPFACPPECTAGETFLGYGADTTPKCKSGCAYAIGSETRYTDDGALSRWVNAGTACTGGDTLTAANTSGCPNETPVDLKPILCGLPSPCAEGQFLFLGQCVADTSETGCVLIDGEQVCAEADQNCVVIDGKRVCAEAPSPADLETYKDNGCVWSLAQGAWVCPTDTAKTEKTSTTTSVTDPVTGNTTKTTVTTQKDNLLPGVTTTTTTTVFDPDGNELSSESVSSSTGSGGQAAALISRAPVSLGEKADLDWLRTYEEVKESLSTQWDELEIVQAVKSFQNLSLTAVEGVCPEFCLPLWGETLCTTAHCDIWAQISFVIQGVLLALYGMASIRIVLSA